MIANNSWLVYMRNFPGFEEVKRTEKYMRNAYVVPKPSTTSLQQEVRQSLVFYLQLKGEISK